MKKTAFALATAFTLTTAAFGATADAASHTVQSGDTLWGISQKYNTSVEQIMQDNSLQSTLIFPKEVLEVNEAGSTAAPQVAVAASTYTVADGDTLAKISQKVNVSITNLVAWNGIASADDIYAGDVLALNEASRNSAKVTTIQVAQTAPAAKVAPVAQQKAAKPAAQQQQKTQQAAKQAQQTQAAAPAGEVAKTLTMSATAYTAYCAGCSGVTANGTNLRANPGIKVIAVDPRVIPLGTKVWVEGYGTAIAADTGGAIKGNKIDVFIPTQEGALAWGRKSVTVKILN